MSSLTSLMAKSNRAELLRLRRNLALAKRAHSLLEEKAKLLLQEADRIRASLLPLEEGLTAEAKSALELVSEAIVSLGVRKVVLASFSTKRNDVVDFRLVSLRGITVPRIRTNVLERSPVDRGYSLRESDFRLDAAAGAMEKVLRSLLDVAETRNAVRILEGEARRTAIRISALDKVLISNMVKRIREIENRLEEMERENQSMRKRFIELSSRVSR